MRSESGQGRVYANKKHTSHVVIDTYIDKRIVCTESLIISDFLSVSVG